MYFSILKMTRCPTDVIANAKRTSIKHTSNGTSALNEAIGSQ